jgi:hypothetical protein
MFFSSQMSLPYTCGLTVHLLLLNGFWGQVGGEDDVEL